MRAKQKTTVNKFHYISDTPCKYGHEGLRYISNGACVACITSDRRKKIRDKWRAANAERIRLQDKQYAKDHAKEISAYHKEHYIKVQKPRYSTPERRAHISKVKRLRYQRCKDQYAEQSFEYYKSFKLPPPNGIYNEAAYELYVMWSIINELNVPVLTQYVLPSSKFKIDLFIPILKLGIEVKLDTPNWTHSEVKKQVAKYEQILGADTVRVVSPFGKYQHTLPTLLAELKTLLEIRRECLIDSPS